MAMDALTLAGKQYSELLQEYNKVHGELAQMSSLLQGIASGEIDHKRLKALPGGVQLMPEQPPAAEKGNKSGKNGKKGEVPELQEVTL